MKPKILFLLLILSLALTGCFTDHVIPYSGQQHDWPTATGAFVTTNTVVPVYYGYPPRPYTYLAQIQVNDISGLSLDVAREAARVAKEKSADAVLVLQTGERAVGVSSFGGTFGNASTTASGSANRAGNYAAASGTANTFLSSFGSGFISVQYGGQITAIAIEWKTNNPTK